MRQFPAALAGGLATFAESLFSQIARFIASQVPLHTPHEQLNQANPAINPHPTLNPKP